MNSVPKGSDDPVYEVKKAGKNGDPSSAFDGKNRQPLREEIRRRQASGLCDLLHYIWSHSEFYRDYYAGHGIREKDLSEVSIGDLPFLSKKTLIDNFDGAVTNPQLKRSRLEHWFHAHPDPAERFLNEFVVIHGSGTSGDIGIFAYDQTAWRIADATMADRLPRPENYPASKTKVAFYVASHGHFATVSMATTMPQAIYETLIVSLMDSRESAVSRLNAFRPDRLHGYSSSIAELADAAIEGALRIQPKRVIVGGDKLTEAMERKIREAWGVPVHVIYAASESKYIAVREPGQKEMRVMDDLNIVEVLNEDNQPSSGAAEGRVVLTNLYNYTLPILRYELGDYVVRGTGSNSPFTTLLDIRGRVNDALPVVLQDGQHDAIHPIVLTTFHVEGLEKIQFVSHGPQHTRIDYVAGHDIEAALRAEFQQMLGMKGATRTTFEIRRVNKIENDPKTGKLRLVKMEPRKRPQHSIESSGTEAPGGNTETANYRIVMNQTGQFALWPAAQNHPPAWKDTGRAGSNADCLASIKEIRTEMKPPGAEGAKHAWLHELFEEQVKRLPKRVAVASGEDDALTYAELNARANQLARHLRSLGVGAETRVAVCLRRSVETAVGILGVLKAGGAWLPLDPAHPKERQELVFDDARPAILLTEGSLPAQLPEHRTKTVLLDNDRSAISRNSKSDLRSFSASLNTAYIMYTSGSTGKPKGVVITHSNLCHYVVAMGRALGITEDDSYLHTATVAFSSSVRQLLVPLTHGARAVIATTDEIQDPLVLLDRVQRDRITVLDMVPSYWRNAINLLAQKDSESLRACLDNDVRLIATTGETLFPDLAAKWTSEFNHPARLLNLFGQTETTGTVATYAIPIPQDSDLKTVPIGGPIANTDIYLLDDQKRLVAIGAAGEIHVGGPSLGQAYLNRPDLTAESFIPSPFSDQPGNRLYRTGDLARYRLDGALEFLGRIDHQVKIRGIRVELGEIEAVVGDHPAVRQAVVVAHEEDRDNKRLVAYVVPQRGRAAVVTELRSFLKEKLPDYMIPSVFMLIEELPLTASGKIDRRSLPPPDQSRGHLKEEFVAPSTPVEQQIAGIWAEILKVERIGIHDNFFDLGAHSLLATQLVSRLREELQVELPLRMLFENPTVAELAVQIAQAQAKRAGAGEVNDLLNELDALSDEDAERLLAQETPKAFEKANPSAF